MLPLLNDLGIENIINQTLSYEYKQGPAQSQTRNTTRRPSTSKFRMILYVDPGLLRNNKCGRGCAHQTSFEIPAIRDWSFYQETDSKSSLLFCAFLKSYRGCISARGNPQIYLPVSLISYNGLCRQMMSSTRLISLIEFVLWRLITNSWSTQTEISILNTLQQPTTLFQNFPSSSLRNNLVDILQIHSFIAMVILFLAGCKRRVCIPILDPHSALFPYFLSK